MANANFIGTEKYLTDRLVDREFFLFLKDKRSKGTDTSGAQGKVSIVTIDQEVKTEFKEYMAKNNKKYDDVNCISIDKVNDGEYIMKEMEDTHEGESFQECVYMAELDHPAISGGDYFAPVMGTKSKSQKDEKCSFVVSKFLKNYSAGFLVKGDEKAKAKPDYKTFKENKAARIKICYGAACAVDYVHKLGYIHCDIKPDNIFLDSGLMPKLGDFGLLSTTKSPRTGGGTSLYNDISQTTKWSQEADIYSLCFTFLIIISLDDKITKDRYEEFRKNSELKDLKAGLLEILIQGMNPQPKERPSLRRIMRALHDNCNKDDAAVQKWTEISLQTVSRSVDPFTSALRGINISKFNETQVKENLNKYPSSQHMQIRYAMAKINSIKEDGNKDEDDKKKEINTLIDSLNPDFSILDDLIAKEELLDKDCKIATDYLNGKIFAPAIKSQIKKIDDLTKIKSLDKRKTDFLNIVESIKSIIPTQKIPEISILESIFQ